MSNHFHHPKHSYASPTLQLQFFTTSHNQISPQTQQKQQLQLQSEEKQKQKYINIDMSLLNYQQHYLKDIHNYFPNVKFTHLLYCPKIMGGDWQLIGVQQWKERCQKDQAHENMYFAVFYDHLHARQYFESSLELITIILEKDNGHVGFIGYVPSCLLLLDLIVTLCKFYGIELSEKSAFISQISDNYQQLRNIQNEIVQNVAGNYIKVQQNWNKIQTNQMQNEQNLDPNMLPDLVDQNQLIVNRYIDYNMESIETNLAMSGQLWHSTTDIQTCIQLKKESVKKLITMKNGEQLQKLKNRARLKIKSSEIEIPIQGEMGIQLNLSRICEQLCKYINK